MLRRFSVFSLAFLLCLSLFPSRALAFDVGVDLMPNGSYWGGMTDSENYGSFVRANNKYDAAVYSLGLSVPESIPVEVRSKLSDPNYGGRFYEYAQTFYNVQGWPNMPEWLPAYAMGFVGLAASFDRIYASNASVNLRTGAEIDYRVIVGGGDVGGGGSSSSGDYYALSLDAGNIVSRQSQSSINNTYNTAYNATFNSGSVVLGSGSTKFSFWVDNPYYVSGITLYVSPAVQQFVSSLCSEGKQVFVNCWPSGYGGVRPYDVQLFVCDSFEVYRSPEGNDTYTKVRFVNAVRYMTRVSSLYHDSSGIFGVLDSIPSSGVSYSADNYQGFYGYFTGFYVPPSGVWPDSPEPESPTAPELPEPAEPVVQTPVTPTVPAPVWPDITINIDNDPTPGTTPSGLDYTELLTRINDNLISIDSFARAINSNLNSLRSDLLAEFNGVYDSLRNIYSYLLTIDTVLETHCVHLRNKIEESAVFIANYMRTLIKWLADQLDYDDLTNVEAPDNSLLTTINEKLGGGTYEPNPIKDEQGYYEWLDDLWDRFLLGDNWQSSMGNISGSFSELKTRFPFSVPWDIVALFRLFVHDPVTPVFDLPLYFSADGSTPVHVDLSPWDSVASLVRPMVFVIFALKLALLSRDLLGGLGADKGGL